MHWADRVAKRVIEQRPDNDIYVCAAGISPSGAVHIGNFRDVATAYFVALSIKKLGKKSKLLFSWDDFDRFRKVPQNVPETFAEHIGKPYTMVPDPYGDSESYASHFQSDFIEAMRELHIPIEFRYQTKEYSGGRYAPAIIKALQKRKEIYDILARFRTQAWNEDERENYYPISIYSSKTGKDNTKVIRLSEDCSEIHYECLDTGFREILNVNEGGSFKLPWKIDWPMRWKEESVVFEPGGTDHATPGGSFDVAKVIAKKIFEFQAPVFEGYAFVRLKGESSKMSGSSGNLLTPKDLLRVYQPEILRWMFARYTPNKEFNIALDEDVLKTYDEFDRALANHRKGKGSPDSHRSIELALIEDRSINAVPFRQLAGFSNVFNNNDDALASFFERIGTPYNKEDFTERRQRADYWLRNYSPSSAIDLRSKPNWEYFQRITDEEKQWVRLLAKSIEQHHNTIEDLNHLLYAIPKRPGISDEEKKTRQRRFFTIIYQLLIDKDTGPRMSTFLFALESSRVKGLLSL